MDRFRFLRDRDSKYGGGIKQVAKGSSIGVLKTPYRAPKASAICERFLGSVWRECLDHLLILGGSHLYRVIKEYVVFFNQARPHQGIKQRIPGETPSEGKEERQGKIIALPVLNGLHHGYQRAGESLKTVGTNADEVFGEHRLALDPQTKTITPHFAAAMCSTVVLVAFSTGLG